MTPKEKAKELLLKYLAIQFGDLPTTDAKQCALILIDEILNNNCGSHTDEANAMNEEIYCDEYYWHEVKKEIELL